MPQDQARGAANTRRVRPARRDGRGRRETRHESQPPQPPGAELEEQRAALYRQALRLELEVTDPHQRHLGSVRIRFVGTAAGVDHAIALTHERGMRLTRISAPEERRERDGVMVYATLDLGDPANARRADGATPAAAAHVLHRIGEEGGWPGSMVKEKLLDFLAVADVDHLRRMELAYPEYVAALRLAHAGQVDQLRAIVGTIEDDSPAANGQETGGGA